MSENPIYRVYVNRMASDFANDVMGIYKAKTDKLCSRFSVKFENETVGSGPVREYFSLLTSMLIQGFLLYGERKSPTLIFEGKDDHKIPVSNSLLRSTGIYKAVGRMIANFFLHCGPPVFGISGAVVNYLLSGTTNDVPLLEVADILDVDL